MRGPDGVVRSLAALLSLGVILCAGQLVQAVPRRGHVYGVPTFSARSFWSLRSSQKLLRRQTTNRNRSNRGRNQGKAQGPSEAELAREWEASMLGELDGAVSLTTEQKTSIQPLLANEAKQILALGNNRNYTGQAKQERLQEIQQASWTKIDKLLTPDQQQKLDEKQSDALLDQLSQQLTLTADQKAKIRPLLEDEARQVAALEKDATLTKEERKSKSEAIDDTTWSQIEPLLTDDQQQKLDQIRLDQMLANLTKSLGLTEEQKTKIKTSLDETLPKIREIRENKTLTPEVKEDRLQGVRDAMWQQVYATLTSEQQKKLEELRYNPQPQAKLKSQSGLTVHPRRKRR